jgi:hypothetical protein
LRADGYNRDAWPEIIDWMAEHIVRFENALRKPLADAARVARQTGDLG